MADFALDPALFGVTGPSSAAAGRVRNIPASATLQPGASKATTRNGGSSSEDDEDDDDEGDDDSSDDDDEDEADDSSSDDDEQEDEEDSDDSSESDAGSSSRRAGTAAKAGAKEATASAAAGTSSQPAPSTSRLPPLPSSQPASAQAKGKGKAAVYPGFETDAGAETGLETDYGTDAGGPVAAQKKKQDLNRIISAIRTTSVSTDPTAATNRGVLGTEWDRTMQQEMEEMEAEEELRNPYSRPANGKRKGYGRPTTSRGRVAAADIEPSPEVANLLGQANLSYALGNLKEAINIYTEIIRIEPSTKRAWLGLAGVHKEMGNRDKELQSLIVATHLRKSHPDDWKSLALQSKELGLLEQAIYCYGQASKSDRRDVDVIWDRADLLRETGKTRQAMQAFAGILKIQPHAPTVIRELAPMHYEMGEPATAVKLYLASFEHFKSTVPKPQHGSGGDDIMGFAMTDLELLSDFLRSQKRWREAARVITQGVRWLQGRSEESVTWESFQDDREYDLTRKTRPGWENHPQKWSEDAPTHPLGTGLRLRLGLCRLGENTAKAAEEAKIHFDVIRNDGTPDENPEYYGEIADAYYDRKMYPEALEVFYDMSENDVTNVPAVWIKIAQCQRKMGDLEAAAECYQAVISSEPNDLDSRLALAEVYERLDDRERALELVNEVLEQRRKARAAGHGNDEDLSSGSGSDYQDEGDNAEGEGEGENGEPRRKGRRKQRGVPGRRRGPGTKPRKTPRRYPKYQMTREERVAQEIEEQEAFDDVLMKLREIDGLLGEPTESDLFSHLAHYEGGGLESPEVYEWLDCAAYLVDTYRTTRALFPSDGKKKYTGIFKASKRHHKTVLNVDEQAQDIAQRLQASMVDDERPADEPDDNINVAEDAYRKVSFDEWARIAVRYAFMLTLVNERGEAEEVLKHLMTSSNMRQDAPRLQFLHLALCACYMHTDEYGDALEHVRRVLVMRKEESEPLRLLSSVCSAGLPGLDAFLNTKFQKYLLRQIKIHDNRALPSAEDDDDNDNDSAAGEADATTHDNEAGFKATKVNPYFLMLYGHIMAAGKSYHSALVYYLRAYEIRQDDPMICLSLAVGYLHRGMQRQADNRHYQLSLALNFMSKYRKYRGNDEEVNYNIARMFHQLGVVDLAVKHYEIVLGMEDERRRAVGSPSAAQMVVDREGGQVTGTPGEAEQSELRSKPLNLSKEAAYNLSSLYFTRGAPDLARNVVDKYLSL